ncbi:MAG: L-aspartate oxidase [Planctomycetaceae bacterium]|nr:L-aspartate oxidase [Planctomycetaceae bacterium]
MPVTLEPPRRYLVSFHPKNHPHFFTDVLIIGAGLAGLRAALAVDPALDVVLLCKSSVANSNSVNAQGGIASVWGESDTFESHISDTLIAGGDLCDPEVVEHIIRRGPEEIQKLIEIGTAFDRSGEKIALGREGGHAHNRILHALGDATGKEIVRAVVEEVQRRPNVRIWENTFVLDLFTSGGKCCGAIVNRNKPDDHHELIWAKQTILATGGIGQIYRETSNPEGATGDGIAAAYRAGAEVRDMEFVQFHPTVLYIAGGSRALISEAMRGEGAFLVDKNGHRFMHDYDPRGELAPRDVVSRAIVQQMNKTNHPNVYLDLSHKEADWVHRRFPTISSLCMKFGINIATERIPVRPGTHYLMGGVTIDKEGRTTLPCLWAAGECASSGLHGANRLASNSLLEALVIGESCGRLAGQVALSSSNDYQIQPVLESAAEMNISENRTENEDDERIDLTDIRNSLKSIMWRHAGVLRDAEGLSEALENGKRWSHYVLLHQFNSFEGYELQNMILVSQLILLGALLREETRGAHNREDFPESRSDLAHHHFAFQV